MQSKSEEVVRARRQDAPTRQCRREPSRGEWPTCSIQHFVPMADAPTPAPEAAPATAPPAPTEDVAIKPDPAASEPEESSQPDEVRGSLLKAFVTES